MKDCSLVVVEKYEFENLDVTNDMFFFKIVSASHASEVKKKHKH